MVEMVVLEVEGSLKFEAELAPFKLRGLGNPVPKKGTACVKAFRKYRIGVNPHV